MRRKMFLAALIVSAIAPAQASALRYAGPSGVPMGTCATPATACSLSAAIVGNATSNPSAGEEVIVLPGAYSMSSTLNPGASNMFIHGDFTQPAPTISNTSVAGRLAVGSGTVSYLRLSSGFSTEALSLYGGTAERVFVSTSGGGGSPACQCYGGLLRDSVLVTTGPSPAGGIVSNGGSATMTYRNVTAYSTNAAGPALSLNQQDPMNGNISFTAINTIALNTAGGTDVKVTGHDTSFTISRSNYRTTSASGGGTIQDAAGPAHQTALPMFTNPAALDFSQLPASPTIDAGTTDPLNGSDDFAGNPRTAGSSTDIGAYEYKPPDPPAGKPAQKCKKKKKKGKKKSAAQAKKKKKKGCKKKRKKKG